MSYPFVPAKHFTANVMRDVRAVVWHMAEGGGTVSYLQTTSRNVSAHFVVERSGRVVQMVRFSDASHHCSGYLNESSNPASDSGIYGFHHAREVLGPDGVRNINLYTLSVEVEGFAKDGPNAAQADAMQVLALDLRRRYPNMRGALGHRDVTEIKPCPGKYIPWARLGGHGLWGPRGDKMIIARGFNRSSDMVANLPKGTVFYKAPNGAVLTTLSRDSDVEYFGDTTDGWQVYEISTGAVSCDGQTPCPVLVYCQPGTGVPRAKDPVVDPTPYSEEDLIAAVEQDREKAKIVWG